MPSLSKSRIFYNEEILKTLSIPNLKINSFPLNLKAASEKVPIYSKFFINKNHHTLFINYLDFLATGKWGKKISEIKPIEDQWKLQAKLKKSLFFRMSTQQYKLITNKVNILQTKVIDTQFFYGLFIHRQLNMPDRCYSFETTKKGVKFQMKNIENSMDLGKLSEKKMLYNRNVYGQFYVDSYENFIQNQECIKRELVEVNTQITGAVFKGNEKIMDLNGEGRKNLMQIQTMMVKNQSDEPLITDMDFFSSGNPHVL